MFPLLVCIYNTPTTTRLLTFSPSLLGESIPCFFLGARYRNYYDLCWLLIVPNVILCSNTCCRFDIRSCLRQLTFRPLRVRVSAFHSCSCCIYVMIIRAVIGLLFRVQHRPYHPALICSFFSSARIFAASFLQIPPRDGHPCSWLMLLTAKRIRVFHPIADTHAWRTPRRGSKPRPLVLFPLLFIYINVNKIVC